MCGILGHYGFGQDLSDFEKNLSLLAHRGPDAFGTYSDKWGKNDVLLGHRRLSIIDVSVQANQPMVKEDLILIYNGEIYNYQELRAELIALGAEFATQSDTEVVLEGWRYWGVNMFSRLRGMFAFALYNSKSGDLYLVRDAFGIKPLFYTYDEENRRLAFASELKALRTYLKDPTDISSAALCASLLYVWIPEEYCILNEVHKLAPGSYAHFHPDTGFKISHYWQVEKLILKTEPKVIDDLGDIVEESILAHMVADVPVGTFLSGGLDSSLITAIAAQHSENLECFTIGFSEADMKSEAMPDDLLYARRLATKLGLKLHEIEAEPNVSEMLLKLVKNMDEPIGDAAAINVMRICEAAKERGIKVLLSGMGADEVFGGYRRHQAALHAATFRKIPKLAQSVIEKIALGLPVAGQNKGYKLARWAKRFMTFASLSEEESYRRSYTYYDESQLGDLTNHKFDAEIQELFKQHATSYARAGEGSSKDDHIRRMCMTDVQMFMVGLNLTYTDRASMFASTEVRVPFIDHKVIEAAFRLPGNLKIRNGQQKYALKKAAERWLDRDIIYRPKASFGLPLRSWTRYQLRDMIHDLLPGGILVEAGLINRQVIEKMLKQNESGEQDLAQAIWHLLVLELWMRENSAI